MTARWIVIPKWDEFQHYRDRDPKWIKVYSSLLNDDVYLDLSGHRRSVLHGLWLLYAMSNRKVRVNASSLSRRLNLRITSADLQALVTAGFVGYVDKPDDNDNEWESRYVSSETRKSVLARDRHRCLRCGSHDHLEIDHITPISKGGSGDIENLQTLCRKCNRSKHDKESVYDLSSIGLASVSLEVELENKRLKSLSADAPVDNSGNGEVFAKRISSAKVKEFRPYDPPRDRVASIRGQVEKGIITDRVTLEAEIHALGVFGVEAQTLRDLLPDDT